MSIWSGAKQVSCSDFRTLPQDKEGGTEQALIFLEEQFALGTLVSRL